VTEMVVQSDVDGPPQGNRVLVGAAALVVVAVFVIVADARGWKVWPGVVAISVVAFMVLAFLATYADAKLRASAKAETTRLEGLIVDRLPSEDPRREAHKRFVVDRFSKHLYAYARQAPWYGGVFNVLSLGAIVAALGSSGLAASASAEASTEEVRWTVFGLGLLVAAFTAINQLWRPAQRGTSRYRAANALRQQGWDFALARGRYAETNYSGAGGDSKATEGAQAEADSSPEGNDVHNAPSVLSEVAAATTAEPETPKASITNVRLFVDEVSKILRDAEAIDETAPEVTATASS